MVVNIELRVPHFIRNSPYGVLLSKGLWIQNFWFVTNDENVAKFMVLFYLVQTMKKEFGEKFASITDGSFTAKYRASCYCNAVEYEVRSEPVDAKICHCLGCQKLHGAPMQWAAIFHKSDVRITKGIEHLHFYNNEFNKHERILPCKVSCVLCGTLIADEGRNMWLAFPSLFDFGGAPKVPKKFKPTCHIFYSMRIIDMDDDLPKWSGHKNKSEKL